MFAFTDFSEIATVSHSIVATNPAIVTRLRKQAASFSPHEIAAAWALVATEHQLSSLDGWLGGDSPLH